MIKLNRSDLEAGGTLLNQQDGALFIWRDAQIRALGYSPRDPKWQRKAVGRIVSNAVYEKFLRLNPESEACKNLPKVGF
jgi:hypothetical protein